MHSPNDPLFYMHHAFVDMVWAEWQRRNPRSPSEGSRFGERYNVNTVLPFFNITVRSTLDISRYCYGYNRFPRNVQVHRLPANIQNSVVAFSRRNPFTRRWGCQRVRSLLYNQGRGFTRTRLSIPEANTGFKQKKRNPLPDSYIQMNNLNTTLVRQYEQEDADLVDLINSLSYSPMGYAQTIIDNFF
ncbi:Tyrosinase [Entomophthora muscae]|uniref:Tyrosinase n=1 Tax=Entomophthora muscae TaxID=34485 RepID=A0ACC2SGE0_9FUNG|nr:Tyrosinase [Entomophthora muscae]